MDEFEVWDGWDKEDDQGPGNNHRLTALDAEGAAEEFVRLQFANLDYPEEQQVTVRARDGTETQWLVWMSQEPVFHAESKQAAERREQRRIEREQRRAK